MEGWALLRERRNPDKQQWSKILFEGPFNFTSNPDFNYRCKSLTYVRFVGKKNQTQSNWSLETTSKWHMELQKNHIPQIDWKSPLCLASLKPIHSKAFNANYTVESGHQWSTVLETADKSYSAKTTELYIQMNQKGGISVTWAIT